MLIPFGIRVPTLFDFGSFFGIRVTTLFDLAKARVAKNIAKQKKKSRSIPKGAEAALKHVQNVNFWASSIRVATLIVF